MTPTEMFTKAYMLNVAKEHALHPENFKWPIEKLGEIVSRMVSGFANGTAQTGSVAFKDACKMCKIKPAAKTVKAFLNCKTLQEALMQGLIK